VQVCPTGIDIREGLQYECIGCAACIDGCDQVMAKMGYPKGLIRYSTENALAKGWSAREIAARVARPRVLVYSAILVAIVGAAGANLWMRVPIKMDVIRDRGSVAREVADDRIENVYRLQVMNTDERPHRFTLGVEGSEHLRHLELLSDRQPMEIGAVASEPIAVRVRAEPHDAEGAQKIEFVLRTVDGDGSRPVVVHEKSRFLVPSSLARKDSHDEH
jgi:polyferredoxin